MARGLLDTSVLLAFESGRQITADELPDESVISAVTLGELQSGVHSSTGIEDRSQRLNTLNSTADIELLPIDEEVAAAWAVLRSHLKESGCKVHVNHIWIAATALANRIPVYTQDADFDVLDGVGGLEVMKV